MANCIIILGQCCFNNYMPKVRKGKTITTFDYMHTFRDVFMTSTGILKAVEGDPRTVGITLI